MARQRGTLIGGRRAKWVVLALWAALVGVFGPLGLKLPQVKNDDMVLSIWELVELWFAVALGVLIDTFLVRSILVPSIVWLVGERIWWPSTAASGSRAPITGSFPIMPRESVEP